MRPALTAMVTGVVGVLAAFVAVPAPPAYACTCVAATEKDFAGRADVVVQAVVTDLREPTSMVSSAHQVQVRLEVERVDKGEAAEHIALTTPRDEASCGFTFEEGRRYLIYARAGETTLCSGNQQLDAVSSESAVPTPAAATAAIVVGVPLLVVGFAGLLIYRRRHRSA